MKPSVSGASLTNKGRSLNGYNLYEFLTNQGTASVTINGGGKMDELRLFPKNAQMVTYTYAPLIGMTSQCDINNHISYYEYDLLGRLNLVRDQDRNILKKICYNYAGQPESCGLNTTSAWQPTGTTRCQPCSGNNSYTSNVQEHEEKDNNPYSATYNTFRWVSDGVSSNCAIPADWQNTTSSIRCKSTSGQNTGEQEKEQKDMNPCSSTYNQLRWVVTGTNCTSCPATASWRPTGNTRCQLYNGDNTGYQEREERDSISCSSTYNQLRWTSFAYNLTSCPLPCNSSTCTGVENKCVNGMCETGIKIYTFSFDNGNGYTCIYHYEWSDNSWSQNYTEDSAGDCPVTP
jgi:hypothetical protein